MGLFDIFKKEEKFPPTPKWKPSIIQPIEIIIDRMKYYTNNKNDLVFFKNGTCVIIDNDLSDEDAKQFAKEVLNKIYTYHPDMKPTNMDDGNLIVQYNHPAVNVVLEEYVQKNWKIIDKNHQNALATHEVLITPLGNNVFDDEGKKALFGRCFMFMDAQKPIVTHIIRKNV